MQKNVPKSSTLAVSQETAVGKTLKMPMSVIFGTFFATRGTIRYLKMAKKCQKSLMLACFCNFKVPYGPVSGKILSYSCRGGPQL